MSALPFFEDPYLRALWQDEFDDFQSSPAYDTVPQVNCEFKEIRSVCEALHFDDKLQTEWIAAHWRHALRDQNDTEAFDAKKFLKPLLTQRTTIEEPLRQRILYLDQQIT